MIVITYLDTRPRHALPGDEFHLRVHDDTGAEVVVRERITVEKVIDFIASYRFALEDGTCPGFHLSGVFACSAELPKELREAVRFEALSDVQRANFIASVGVKLA